MSVAFQPPEAGTTYEGALVIFNTGDPAVLRIPLFGESRATGRLESDPSAIEFQEVNTVATVLQTVELRNPGDLPVTLERFRLENGTTFALVGGSCSSELEGHTACSIEVQFDPSQPDEFADRSDPSKTKFADRLLVFHSGDGSPLAIDISGSVAIIG